jgi:hypothetical protein
LERGPGSISSGSASIKESAEEDAEDTHSTGTATLSHRKRSPSQLQQQHTFGPPLPIKQEPKEEQDEKMEIEEELNEESLSSSSSVVSSLSRSSAEPEAGHDPMESEANPSAAAEPASAPPAPVVHDTVESAAAAALAAITNGMPHYKHESPVQAQPEPSQPQSNGEDRPMEEAN